MFSKFQKYAKIIQLTLYCIVNKLLKCLFSELVSRISLSWFGQEDSLLSITGNSSTGFYFLIDHRKGSTVFSFLIDQRKRQYGVFFFLSITGKGSTVFSFLIDHRKRQYGVFFFYRSQEKAVRCFIFLSITGKGSTVFYFLIDHRKRQYGVLIFFFGTS